MKLKTILSFIYFIARMNTTISICSTTVILPKHKHFRPLTTLNSYTRSHSLDGNQTTTVTAGVKFTLLLLLLLGGILRDTLSDTEVQRKFSQNLPFLANNIKMTRVCRIFEQGGA